MRAVVFAYHNVGVRCLAALLRHGVDVPLVVTHEDNPDETIWFESVAALARRHNIRVVTPTDPNTAELIAEVEAAQPDFLFSFYYRNMLKAPLLALAARGNYNMHGSLLPKYRGRVPVNWAIIHGETETGATLHAMTEKPDNGAIVAQEAIPIGPDDTAQEVFNAVTGAAVRALERVLPALLAGTAPTTAQDLTQGGYFKGRKPGDGRIDFAWGAQQIHNFVRALTHPYPGAFADVMEKRILIWRSGLEPLVDKGLEASPIGNPSPPRLFTEEAKLILACADGRHLRILSLEADGEPVDAVNFARIFGSDTVQLA